MPADRIRRNKQPQVTIASSVAITLLTLWGAVSCVALDLQDTLPSAMLNNPDPEIIRDGLPTLLILADALIEAAPDDSDYLLTGTRMYSTYASTFVGDDPERRTVIADRTYQYGHRALCIEVKALCDVVDQPFDAFSAAVEKSASKNNLPVVYAFAGAWSTWLQANTGDFFAIAQLPKIERLFEAIVAIDESYEGGNAHLYLGVIKSQTPPALGGQPDVARQHFERAISLSGGRNLFAKVLFAENYARLVYDRALHDRLLDEVLAAPTVGDQRTLINTLAKKKAAMLLAESNDFFE